MFSDKNGVAIVAMRILLFPEKMRFFEKQIVDFQRHFQRNEDSKKQCIMM
jgi:hypothetical protein